MTRPDAPEGVPGYLHALTRLATGAAARLAAAGLYAVSTIAFVAVTVRSLGTSSYGLLAFLLSVVALLAGLSRAGWGTATVHAIAVAETEAECRRVASAAMVLALAASVLAGLVVVAMLPSTARGLGGAERLFLLGGLLLLLLGTNLAGAASSIARGRGRAILSETASLLVVLIKLVVLIAVVGAGARSIGSASVALAAGGVAGVAGSWAVARSVGLGLPLRRGGADIVAVRRLLIASAPFVMQTVATMAIARFDVVILGLTATRTTVGEYEGTLRITERLLQLVPFLLSAQFLPVAAALWRDSGPEAFARLYRTATWALYWTALPIAVVLVAFPEPLLHLLYGEGFRVRPGVVWVLVAGLLPSAVLALSWAGLVAAGNRRAIVRVSTLTLAVMLASAAVLIPRWGAMGAAAATAVSLVTQQVGAAVALRRHAGVHLVDRNVIGLLGRSALLCLLALAMRRWLIDQPPAWAALASVALGMAWLASVWRLEEIGPAGLLAAVRGQRP